MVKWWLNQIRKKALNVYKIIRPHIISLAHISIIFSLVEVYIHTLEIALAYKKAVYNETTGQNFAVKLFLWYNFYLFFRAFIYHLDKMYVESPDFILSSWIYLFHTKNGNKPGLFNFSQLILAVFFLYIEGYLVDSSKF